MLLTGPEIIARVNSGKIVIDPFDPSEIGPNSYDLRLGDLYGTYTDVYLDAKKEPNLILKEIPDTGLVLNPYELYICSTFEYTETLDTVPFLEGKSSIGRLGIMVHLTAGVGDMGFKGYWTLELAAIKPVIVYKRMPICQIIYCTTYGDIQEYKGNYQGQENRPVGSRMYKTMKRIEDKNGSK